MGPERFTLESALERVRGLGWTPGGIVDVGVGAGTPGLYTVWPDTPLCLIEPTPDGVVYMEQIAARHANAHIFSCGASDHNGVLVGRQPEGFRRIFFGRGKGFPEKLIPVRTCDDMVAEAGLVGPLLLKIDTDCHEREVLAGAEATLAQTDVCVIETNVFHELRGMAPPTEIWRVFAERGFAFFDVAGFSFGESGVMRAIDIVFVKAASPLFREAHAHSGKSAAKRAKRVQQYRAYAESNPLV
jgi:FkbM family methyltransferase